MIDLGNYRRQYFGISRDGRRLVLVNAFCEEHTKEDPDWAEHFVHVFDGGGCYFHLFYDPSTELLFELWVNGFALRTLPNHALQLVRR